MNLQSLISWLLSHGTKIVFILLSAYLIIRFFKIIIRKVVKRKIKVKMSERKAKKAETLISVFEGTTNFVVWIIAVLMILPEFKIDITPILTSLGVAGLAIGMAARSVISDFISGIFIIFENQYNVGDRVKIAGIEGEVREITLRRTIIKDKNNVLHLIPNSQIKIVSKKLP